MTGEDDITTDDLVSLMDEARSRLLLQFSTPLPAPSWVAWKGRARARLWEAVALSMGFEPVAVRYTNAQFVGSSSQADQLAQAFPMRRLANESTIRRTELDLLPRLRMDDGFMRRLQVACECVSAGGPLRPVHGIPAQGLEQAVIGLSEFTAWAQSSTVGWTLPDQFPGLFSESQEAIGRRPRREKASVEQERELLSILAKVGRPDGTVPLHKGGKRSPLKSKCLALALKQPDVFTETTFNAAWAKLKKVKE